MEENRIGRRSFMEMLVAAIGSTLLPSESFARSSLMIKYERIKGTLALKVPLREGVSYRLMAKLYSGDENLAPVIMRFNNNMKLIYDKRKTKYMYIPIDVLKPRVREILDANRFSTFEIDNQGEKGIDTLWGVAAEFLNNKIDINERINILLILNNEINPITGIVYDGQKILVPDSLIKMDLIIPEELPEKIKPIPKPIKPRRKQNPFRTDISRITKKLRPRDLFGARRVRTIGRGRYRITKHTGLDLVAPIGTKLYPISSGIITIAAAKTKFWRNGKTVQYKTNSGLEVTYIHLNKIFVKTGQKINFDTILGEVGITGNSSRNNPHVHVQVKIKGGIVNPYTYVVVDTE